jgi:hypothetical protein
MSELEVHDVKAPMDTAGCAMGTDDTAAAGAANADGEAVDTEAAVRELSYVRGVMVVQHRRYQKWCERLGTEVWHILGNTDGNN